jgi:hypothetical protein
MKVELLRRELLQKIKVAERRQDFELLKVLREIL